MPEDRARRQIAVTLATKMGSRLATFDRTIPVKAVRGGTAELLHVIER